MGVPGWLLFLCVGTDSNLLCMKYIRNNALKAATFVCYFLVCFTLESPRESLRPWFVVLFVASLFVHLEARETLGHCAIQTFRKIKNWIPNRAEALLRALTRG